MDAERSWQAIEQHRLAIVDLFDGMSAELLGRRLRSDSGQAPTAIDHDGWCCVRPSMLYRPGRRCQPGNAPPVGRLVLPRPAAIGMTTAGSGEPRSRVSVLSRSSWGEAGDEPAGHLPSEPDS
jgi:hypothetical protein